MTTTNNFAEMSAKLIMLATSNDPLERERLQKEIAELANASSATEGNSVEAFLKFNEKDFKTMPKTFRKLFKTDGVLAHIRKRVRGNSVNYEIRCRRDGFNISAGGRTVEEAKERFIKKLHTIESNEENSMRLPTTFHLFAQYYVDTIRRRKVAPRTFANDMSRYKKHIFPHFGEIPLRSITPQHCQILLDKLLAEGKGKTVDEIYSFLNGFFKFAISHNLLRQNPLCSVYHEQHERTHGKALSMEEEAFLLATGKEPYRFCFAVALYTGMRPCEYKTLRREGNILICVNAKRKKKKVEYKRIPINPMLAPYLEDVEQIEMLSPKSLWNHLKPLLPNHKLYDLRTTFYTRCKQMSVDSAALKAIFGHSEGRLADAYTDLPDDYLIRESNKINYDLPPILPPNEREE